MEADKNFTAIQHAIAQVKNIEAIHALVSALDPTLQSNSAPKIQIVHKWIMNNCATNDIAQEIIQQIPQLKPLVDHIADIGPPWIPSQDLPLYQSCHAKIQQITDRKDVSTLFTDEEQSMIATHTHLFMDVVISTMESMVKSKPSTIVGFHYIGSKLFIRLLQRYFCKPRFSCMASQQPSQGMVLQILRVSDDQKHDDNHNSILLSIADTRAVHASLDHSFWTVIYPCMGVCAKLYPVSPTHRIGIFVAGERQQPPERELMANAFIDQLCTWERRTDVFIWLPYYIPHEHLPLQTSFFTPTKESRRDTRLDLLADYTHTMQLQLKWVGNMDRHQVIADLLKIITHYEQHQIKLKAKNIPLRVLWHGIEDWSLEEYVKIFLKYTLVGYSNANLWNGFRVAHLESQPHVDYDTNTVTPLDEKHLELLKGYTRSHKTIFIHKAYIQNVRDILGEVEIDDMPVLTNICHIQARG